VLTNVWDAIEDEPTNELDEDESTNEMEMDI